MQIYRKNKRDKEIGKKKFGRPEIRTTNRLHVNHV